MASPNIISTLALDEPQTLIAMTAEARPPAKFLFERYFYTDPSTDIFPTEDILIDYKDKAGRKLAPFVHEGWKTSDRTGFATDKLTPARIAPKRSLTVVDLIKRGYGESLFSGKTGEQRAHDKTMQDITELMDEIRRRYEYMAADLLVNNKYTMTYVKSDDNGESEQAGDVTVSFIDTTEGNICAYTPAAAWTADNPNICGDIKAMLRQLDDNGGAANGTIDLLLGSNAADAFLKNKEIREMFDNRRMEMGEIAPQVRAQGATLMGLLNVDGIMVNVIEYREAYTDGSGKLTPYLPADQAIIATPLCCRALYAAVTQMEQSDPTKFYTYPEKIVPKYLGDAKSDKLEIMMTSRPAFAPVVKGGWVSAKVTNL